MNPRNTERILRSQRPLQRHHNQAATTALHRNDE
jgi:hypothetical protein